MIILQGNQGIGKSLFLYHLLKDKSLFSNTINFSDQYQKIVEAILDKALIEVSEENRGDDLIFERDIFIHC